MNTLGAWSSAADFPFPLCPTGRGLLAVLIVCKVAQALFAQPLHGYSSIISTRGIEVVGGRSGGKFSGAPQVEGWEPVVCTCCLIQSSCSLCRRAVVSPWYRSEFLFCCFVFLLVLSSMETGADVRSRGVVLSGKIYPLSLCGDTEQVVEPMWGS